MKKPVFFLVSLIIIASCQLEYDTSVRDELSESVPSSVLFNVEQIQVKNGNPKASFTAQEAYLWSEKEETELYSVQFLEFDENREIITDGVADYILINDNNDASIKGGISGRSIRNEASIEAENLDWKDETRELSSSIDGLVIISLDGGTVLKGAGFSADFYTETIGFSSRVEGNIESGSDHE